MYERINYDFFNAAIRKPLSEDESAKLFRNFDDSAREKLIVGNLRLVLSIAWGYRNCGIPFTDIFQYGCLGLMRAVEKNDLSKRKKFSSFASSVIKREIQRQLTNREHIVRLPCYLVERVAEVRTACNTLEARLGRSPTSKEICEYTGISKRKIEKLRGIAEEVVYLEDEEGFLEDVPEDYGFNPEKSFMQKERSETLLSLLGSLKPRERKIIELRFGLNGYEMHTLMSAGQMIGMRTENVRLAQKRALKKINECALRRGLSSEDFL